MRRPGGFTTVELLVTVAILAILVAVGVPALNSFMVNTRIRSLGESMTNALSAARADAARLNTRVSFTFDGTNWTVSRVDTQEQLHAGTGRESLQSGLELDVTPEDANAATYDAFGRRMAQNPDGSEPMTQFDIKATNPPSSGGYHPLRIQVLASGLSRLCDPSVASTSPKACL
jgi:type IV fimbrial biogenesis protein FimT